METGEHTIVELPELRNRVKVFHDREHAGEVLAGMLAEYRGTDTRVLGILAGGVPVAAAISRALDLPLDVAVVSKITLPWNTEAGYGAVAFDGTVCLNQDLVESLALGEAVVNDGIARTRDKVDARLKRLRGGRPFPDLRRQAAIAVDDGLASGYTLHAALAALRRLDTEKIIVAVPTGHADSVRRIAAECAAVYCANIREGRSFAVADAYERWTDVAEETAAGILLTFRTLH